jgi:hypothetical protein
MKYIKLELLRNLIRDMVKIVSFDDGFYGGWFYASYMYKFTKKYDKHIIYKYSHSYDDYTDYITLDLFKSITTIMEDYMFVVNGLSDKIRDDVCLFIHKTRYEIIKHAS